MYIYINAYVYECVGTHSQLILTFFFLFFLIGQFRNREKSKCRFDVTTPSHARESRTNPRTHVHSRYPTFFWSWITRDIGIMDRIAIDVTPISFFRQ